MSVIINCKKVCFELVLAGFTEFGEGCWSLHLENPWRLVGNSYQYGGDASNLSEMERPGEASLLKQTSWSSTMEYKNLLDCLQILYECALLELILYCGI